MIDPTLVYSTYLGGSQFDAGTGIVVDAMGNAYVIGSAESADFPTTPGAFQPTKSGFRNAIISKLNAAGSGLIYSTYLGGSSGAEGGRAIVVDASGNAYVIGDTTSADFPTTPGAFQTTFGGDTDAFVTKLNATGSGLIYSTFLGGSSLDGVSDGGGIVVDAMGNAYVTGVTSSEDFPTTPGAFQTTKPGLNGSVHAFVTKLNAAGSALVYSTFLGGSAGFEQGPGSGIAVDAARSAYVTGHTSSPDFPTTPGAFQTTCRNCNPERGAGDAFITKLNAAGSALVYSTFLGGSGEEVGNGIAIDAAGNAYVTGGTTSSDFPITSDAFQPTFGGGVSDVFVSKLNATGSALLYSSYLGGNDIDNGTGIGVNAAGNAYVTGYSFSANFPTIAGAFQTRYGGGVDAFVAKIAVLTFAGTPGTPNCQGQSVSALVRQFGSLNAAASALGFPSVQALQDAIQEFCED